jgi:Tol biopolymer transport system component
MYFCFIYKKILFLPVSNLLEKSLIYSSVINKEKEMDFSSLKTGLTSLFISALLLSCSSQPVVNTVNNKTDTTIKVETKKKTDGKTIAGKVEFEDDDYKVKATTAEVSTGATVSIIYPSSHATMSNKTIASGLSDSSGNFIINPDDEFEPAAGDIFRLEAARRISGSGTSAATLNTYIRWTGSSWESITTPALKINKATTALAIIEINDNSLAPAGTIGKINSANAVYTQTGTVTTQMLNDVAALVDEVLTKNLDPMQYVRINGTKFDINNPEPVLASHADYITYAEYIEGEPNPNPDPECEFNPPPWIECPVPGEYYLYTVKPDGTSKRLVVHAETSVFADLSTSKDGNTIVFKAADIYGTLTYANILPDQTTTNMFYTGSFTDPGNMYPAPDKSKFVITDGTSKLFITDGSSGSAKRISPELGSAGIQGVKWSPDSAKVLFSASNGTRYNIYVYDTKTGISTDLSGSITSAYPVTDAYWSPDSAKVLINVTADASGRNDLYVNNAAGGTPILITAGTAMKHDIFEEVWSPDSAKVIWRRKNAQSDFDLFVVDLAAPATQINLTGSLPIALPLEPRWAPDSQKVVFDITINSFNEAYVAMISGNNTFKITPPNVQAVGVVAEPFFSKDSATVILRGQNTSNRRDIFKVDLNNINNPVNITSSLASTNNYVLYGTDADPTGNKILIKDMTNKVYSVNNDGSSMIPLTNMDSLTSLQWYPDGKKIVYHKNNDLWIVNPDNTGNINLTNDTTRAKAFFSIHLKKN